VANHCLITGVTHDPMSDPSLVWCITPMLTRSQICEGCAEYQVLINQKRNPTVDEGGVFSLRARK
jgi:hypothetical protein